ncbi:MAG TPA: hypothetical protein VF980_09925 [Thermoanaerobaculia bacterium]
MRLTPEEMELFEGACNDLSNAAAQELLNLFAVERGIDVLLQLPTIPLGLFSELVSNLWRAINLEHRNRTGCDLVIVEDSLPVPQPVLSGSGRYGTSCGFSGAGEQ